MRKNIFILFVFLAFGKILFGQSQSTGYWTGTMIRNASVLDISIDLLSADTVISGYFSAPSQKASGIPLDRVTVKGDSLLVAYSSGLYRPGSRMDFTSVQPVNREKFKR